MESTPAQRGAAHALVRGGVRRNRPAQVVRAGHQGLELIHREGGYRLSLRTRAVVGVDLDPVGTGGGLLAHGADDFGDARDFLGALRQVGVIVVGAPGWPVRAPRDDGAGDHRQSWPGNDAIDYGLLERHIGAARAFGTQVTQAGETGQQGLAGALACAQHAQGRGLLEDLVVPQGLVVGVEQQV